MAYYAFLDETNTVIKVISGRDEGEDDVDWEKFYGAKRTSYNTFGNIHSKGGIPFRKNYAGIGYTYDPDRDAFIPPKPFESWILDEFSCLWKPPVPYPTDGQDYLWEESSISWAVVNLNKA